MDKNLIDTNLIDTDKYIFDIKYYIKNNQDLYINGIQDEHSALNHWMTNGKNENRNYRYINVELDSYVKEFNKFIKKKIFTKEEAWDILFIISTKHNNIINIKEEDINEESKKNIIKIIEKKFSLNISDKNKSLNNNSNNNIDNFDWEYYIKNNKDLLDNGINDKNNAIYHWLNFGINENRKHRFLTKNNKLINKKNINIHKKNISIRKKYINM